MSSGGSESTKVKRRVRAKKPKAVLFQDAAVDALGEEGAAAHRRKWEEFETGYGQKHQEKGNGIILSLIDSGLSTIAIRGALGKVGQTRIDKLRKFDPNAPPRIKQPSWNAFLDKDKKAIKDFIATLPVEDGFPCAHRQPKQYVAIEGATWKSIHSDYMKYVGRLPTKPRVAGYHRWTQYVHFYFPNLRLHRTKEDECNCCIRLKLELSNPEITEARRHELKLELETHLDVAIEQRKMMNKIVTDYCNQYEDAAFMHRLQALLLRIDNEDMESKLPEAVMNGVELFCVCQKPEDDRAYIQCSPCQKWFHHECIGLDVSAVDASVDWVCPKCTRDPPKNSWHRIQIQCEDFGQVIPLLWYKFERPGLDYFTSSLMPQNFVIADRSHNLNDVFLYDERLQGKDGDAMCNLRFLYHSGLLKTRGLDAMPKILVSIMDNCVDQNKSQCTMMFFMWLLTWLYDRILLVFLILGHSHMAADRVVSWSKRSLQGRNLFNGKHIAECIDGVKNVSASYLDHANNHRPFFSGWKSIFSKYFKPLPGGYTENYVFEFFQGVCHIRPHVNSPGYNHIFCEEKNLVRFKNSSLNDIFSTTDL